MQSLINIKTILLGFFLLCIGTIFYFNRWKPENIIQHDTKYYYAYLPHFFIQDSLANNVDSIYFLNNPTEAIKMSSGLALVWVPFFSIAHISTYLFINVLPNGYTFPYSISIVASNVFVTLFGLYIVYLLLRKLSFNEHISKAVVVTIFLGTTLYYYTTFELMPHTYLFAGISLLIYLIYIWYNQLTFSKSILLGLLVGWIVLTRPIDVLIIIPILLYVWFSQSFKEIRIYI